MSLFDAAEFDAPAPDLTNVVAVCHRCGARSAPIPSSGMTRKTGWWEGVAFGLIALRQHEPLCPGRILTNVQVTGVDEPMPVT